MKKIFGIILIIITTLAFFTGCNNDSKLPDVIDWGEFEALTADVAEEHLPDGKVVFWNKLTGEVIEQINDSITRCDKIPLGSKYAGYSVWAGYLFQNGTTVYSVYPMSSELSVKVISNSVIDIIDCNEYLTSDAFSNPVFLMKDGTLKGYITWEKELVDYPVKQSLNQ